MTWITDVKYKSPSKQKLTGQKYRNYDNGSSYGGDPQQCNTKLGASTSAKLTDLNDIILLERSKIVSQQNDDIEQMQTKLEKINEQLSQIILDIESSSGNNFFYLKQQRALEYEKTHTDKRIKELQNEIEVNKFDSTVQPYLQAFTHEEERFMMENNAPNSRIMSGGGPKDSREIKENRLNRIIKECLSEVRPDHAPPILQSSNTHCAVCNLPYVLISTLASIVCQKCGRTQNNHIETTTLSLFGKETDNCFHYKRINHLNESLQLFQAKENTVIPEELLQQTMARLLLLGHTNINKISRYNVRDVLRDLGLRKYYENEAQITYLITGKRPPQMSSIQEERMRIRFCAIQGPFRKHCPPDRKNFFSYPYVLYKFCDIEGWVEYLPSFRLHKGGDKRKYLDKIWKKICEELDGQDPTLPWPYKDTPKPHGEMMNVDELGSSSNTNLSQHQFHW